MRAQNIQEHFTLLFCKLYSQAHTGASVNINNLTNAPKVGYMVSVFPIGVYNNIQSVKQSEVIAIAKSFHNGSNKNYLGIWTDSESGKCYIDLSIWIESKDNAISRGKELNEIAIFDLAEQKEIRLEKSNVFAHAVCYDCLQLLVNGESDHTKHQLAVFHQTLKTWSEQKYTPLGIGENIEPYFLYSQCDICDGLAGDRYEYYFIRQ